MSDGAKSGKELLDLVLELLHPGRFYLMREIYSLLQDCGLLNDADLSLHKGGNETKAYRRLQNALRDGAKQGVVEKNEETKPFQYRVAS